MDKWAVDLRSPYNQLVYSTVFNGTRAVNDFSKNLHDNDFKLYHEDYMSLGIL